MKRSYRCDMNQELFVPSDIPANVRETFIKNYQRITKKTDRLFMFVADHKFEHLNDDFFGPEISEQAQKPEHIFQIAQMPEIGAFATHPGLIARYAHAYPSIAYVMKLNGKTNANAHARWWLKPFISDPFSPQLWSVEQAQTIANAARISLCGVGMTVYLGSRYESTMLENAARMVYDAHQQGLIAMIWIYLRGRAIRSPNDGHMLAGAAGIAHSLGADFVKIHPPQGTKKNSSLHQLKEIIEAAGNTGIICSGGTRVDTNILLARIYEQLTQGTRGCAIGRNLFQLPLSHAQKMAKAISDIVYYKTSV